MKIYSTIFFVFLLPAMLLAKTMNVPAEYSTIQAGIDAASTGDTVLVAPGKYSENLKLEKKTITLASHFVMSHDPKLIRQTVIDGAGETVLEIKDVGKETTVTGFTIQNGDDGIFTESKFHLLYNRIIKCKDGIDYEKYSGGLCRYNIFEMNEDDAIDLDDYPDIVIEDNILRNNEDDGIEIRLHEYSGPQITYIIRRNLISGNKEDGIQLIDYPDVSNRVFYIMNNVIEKTKMAAIGCMSDGNTKENYEAADIPEQVYLVNNTLVDNTYGITGGDNMIVLNNIIMKTKNIALKNVDGNSNVSFNCLWQNGTDNVGSSIDMKNTVKEDPMLNQKFQLKKNSPCIDKGNVKIIESFDDFFRKLNDSVSGKALDIGAFEFGKDVWVIEKLKKY